MGCTRSSLRVVPGREGRFGGRGLEKFVLQRKRGKERDGSFFKVTDAGDEVALLLLSCLLGKAL